MKCSQLVEQFGNTPLSRELLKTLEIAEDHRNKFHYGIDQIGIFRATLRSLKGDIQGASTIEQQFVRVSINQYQRTVTRKLFEQLIAVYLVTNFEKKQIATAYLSIAYFGNSKQGILGLNDMTHLKLESLGYSDAIPIISCLKYPEPIIKTKKWLIKSKNRNTHIASQICMLNKQFRHNKINGYI
jgi:membrane carboxypeptidase/penicillin-binding protein